MGPRDKEGIGVAFPRDVARCSPTAAKRVLVVVAVAIFATAGYVLVVPTTGEATPSCIPGTMESYVSLGETGCTIEDKTFSKFAYFAYNGDVPIGAVSVSPVPIPGNPGVTFTGPWVLTGTSSSSENFLDALINFEAKTTSGATSITGASLTVSWSGTGTFHANVYEELCVGFSLAPNCVSNVRFLHVGDLGSPITDSETFAPVSVVGVGGPGMSIQERVLEGTATIASITTQFSEEVPSVPEPAAVTLFGTGVLSLLGSRIILRHRR